MKKTILALMATGAMTMGSVTAWAQEDKAASDARREISEGKKHLSEAKMDSTLDYQNFKNDAEMRIKDNQKKIAALKARKSSETLEVREKYDKKVLALDQKNDELKKKIKESDTTKTTMWSEFKREFTHDMEALGNAIKNMSVDNSK